MHEAVRRVCEGEGIALDHVELTGRERECLLWAAEGKTAWEISQILAVSQRTVVFHLNNATTKLNATNRQHAVARAVARSLLTPQIISPRIN